MSVDLGGMAVLATDPEEANESRGEPQDGGEERKGDDSLELAASVTTGSDVGPVPKATTELGSDKLYIQCE